MVCVKNNSTSAFCDLVSKTCYLTSALGHCLDFTGLPIYQKLPSAGARLSEALNRLHHRHTADNLRQVFSN